MRNKSALAQKIKVGAQKRVKNLSASSGKNQGKRPAQNKLLDAFQTQKSHIFVR